MSTLEMRELSKTYPGGTEAVRSVTLSLEEGEVFGFLGPHGAGKTTTVKLLTGILSPTSGGCSVLGIDPSAQPERAHMVSGIVTEHAQMYDNLTGKDNLIFYASVFGVERGEAARRADELLSRLELEDAKESRLATYSTGMRQRLSLARALIHRPKVLFLDEPTSGLDPESAQNVNRMISSLARDEGTTVFLCTHQLRYAQEICTRYGLIDEGRMLAEGTLERLRERVISDMALRVKANRVPDGFGFKPTGSGEFVMRVRSELEIPVIVREIVNAGADIYSVVIEKPTLEDIYFALTRGAGEGN